MSKPKTFNESSVETRLEQYGSSQLIEWGEDIGVEDVHDLDLDDLIHEIVDHINQGVKDKFWTVESWFRDRSYHIETVNQHRSKANTCYEKGDVEGMKREFTKSERIKSKYLKS